MSIRRPCPLCAHRAPRFAGRCTEPAGPEGICGCACIPAPRSGRPPRETPMSVEAILVLRAVEQGHVWGLGIIAATGLSMTAVYAILRRHREAGLLVREARPGRGSHRHRYHLTGQGRLVLDAALLTV